MVSVSRVTRGSGYSKVDQVSLEVLGCWVVVREGTVSGSARLIESDRVFLKFADFQACGSRSFWLVEVRRSGVDQSNIPPA